LKIHAVELNLKFIQILEDSILQELKVPNQSISYNFRNNNTCMGAPVEEKTLLNVGYTPCQNDVMFYQ